MLRKIMLIALCVLLLAAMAAPTLAWFSSQVTSVFPEDVTGSSEIAYFKSGNGSLEKPYVIANAFHLYNLAWLQYLGYFNLNPTLNNGRAQNYFVVECDVDMEGLAIPPIGTTQYPFLGNLDGGGNVIYGAVTANAEELLQKRPVLAEFGTGRNLLAEFGGDGTEAGAMLGFFGVLGDYDGELADIAAKGGNVDATRISVRNFALYDYTVENDSAAAVVGLAAGYVNAPLVDVALGACTLKGNTVATPLDSTVTGQVSDYTLVGYCTDAYRETLGVNEVKLYDPTRSVENLDDSSGGSGSAEGWGGSVNMVSLHAKLVTLMEATTVTEVTDYIHRFHKVTRADGTVEMVDPQTFTSSPVHMFVNDSDKNSVSVMYMQTKPVGTNVIYLSGGAKVTSTEFSYTDKSVTTYRISKNGNYLNVTTEEAPTITTGAMADSATEWMFSSDGEKQYMGIDVGGKMLYLTVSGSTVVLSEIPETEWLIENGELYFSVDGNKGALSYEDGEWKTPPARYHISVDGNYLSVNDAGEIVNTDKASATSWDVFEGTEGYITTVIGGVTYYLVRNTATRSLGVQTASPGTVYWTHIGSKLRYGRSYYLAYSNGWLVNGVGTEVTLTAGAFASTGGGLACIAAGTASELLTSYHGEEHFEFSTAGLSNATYIPLNVVDTSKPNTGYITSAWKSADAPGTTGTGDIRVAGYDNTIADTTLLYTTTASGTVSFSVSNGHSTLQKYNGTKEAYADLVAENELYGLHFMDAAISKNDLVTVPQASINGITYTNYKVPADCIDFSLKTRGYINFYAGTYYGGSNCFFSLHQIFRDGNKNITAIKEISEIYGPTDASSSNAYVYLYKDGSYSNGVGVPSGFVRVFDMAWLTAPADLEGNAMYYFEVPANAGEYALGSVEGKNGAYLVYLDIASNATTEELLESNRVMLTEYMTESELTYAYASGVGLVQNATDKVTSGDHLALILRSGFTGTLALERTGDTVTFTANDKVAAGALSTGVTLVDSDGGTPTALALHAVTTATKRVTYTDYDATSGVTTVTVITHVQVTTDGVAGTPVITATVNGVSSPGTIVGTTGTVTTLNTVKQGDSIDWSQISEAGRGIVAAYRYDAVSGANVTNKAAYTPADAATGSAASYEITVLSAKELTVTFTEIGTSHAVSAKGSTDGIAVAVTTDSTLTVPATNAS